MLPSERPLGGLAVVTVRLWDNEGNASTPVLQYQVAGSTNWQEATVFALDGASYSPTGRVAALPGGTDHAVGWRVFNDLGAGMMTNVLLRARAQDFMLVGDWSQPTPFTVDTASDSDGDGIPDRWEIQYFGSITHCAPLDDPDHDGMNNLAEYLAGTDPTDPNSKLALDVRLVGHEVRVNWQGGTNGTQYLQGRSTLDRSNGSWIDLLTNLPQVPNYGRYTDLLSTNPMRFYRIRLEK